MPYWAQRPLSGLVLVYGLYDPGDPYMGWLDIAPMWVAPCVPEDPYVGCPLWALDPFVG